LTVANEDEMGTRESGRKRFSTDIVLIVTDGGSVEYGEGDLTDAVLTPDWPQVPLHVKKRTLLRYHNQRFRHRGTGRDGISRELCVSVH